MTSRESRNFVGIPGIIGAQVGSKIGIAACGTAIAGTVPVAAVFATIGLLTFKLIENRPPKRKRRKR